MGPNVEVVEMSPEILIHPTCRSPVTFQSMAVVDSGVRTVYPEFVKIQMASREFI